MLSVIDIKKSEEQEILDALFQLWVDNKISYKTLLKYWPEEKKTDWFHKPISEWFK
jgi:hypothetical protein